MTRSGSSNGTSGSATRTARVHHQPDRRSSILVWIFTRRRCQSPFLLGFFAFMLIWVLSYEPHPLPPSSSSSSSPQQQHHNKVDEPTNLRGWHTLPPLVVRPNNHHSHQFVLVIGSTSSGSKLVTSLCALCLGLTDSIHDARHAGYGDLLLEGRSDVVLHRSLPHGYGRLPINQDSNLTDLDMLLGRHGEMFVDPLTLGHDLAFRQRNYTTVKYVVVIRDERSSIVSSVANRHARGFADAKEHMRLTHSILSDLIMTAAANDTSKNSEKDVLVVDYEGLIQYWKPLWKSTISDFLHCPMSRFDSVDRLKDGNAKYVFSIRAYVNELLFRLRIL